MSNVFYSFRSLIKKSAADLILLLFTVIVCLIVVFSIVLYKRDNIKKYNAELFEIREIQDTNERIQKLDELYYSKRIPKTSKTLFGINLAQEHYRRNGIKRFLEINEEIFSVEKDGVLKNIAGLNILHVKLNEQKLDVEYLEKLFKKLEREKSPFLNVVLEKKGVFYLRQNETKKAKDIFEGLLRDPKNDENFKDRIKEYLEVL
ncbi:MAG: hypothetical protein LBG48_04670 [Rickettsiales bacterium]|jgi:predicted negative regulator of RcsB-dependent stress response|nr:hypothetical protein [Rickettsiales bacterium]